MNLNDIIQKLKAINYALGNVEVRGRENMDILLGSMQQLDRSIAQLSSFKKELEENIKIDIEPVEVGQE